MADELDTMTLQAIMTRWPRTVRVFIDWRLHCIGCPIADYHLIADSASEHGYETEDLKHALRLAIDSGGASSKGPPERRQQSEADGAGLSREASAARHRQARPLPRP